jgi:biopolymer transport protein ExbD
MSQFNCTVVFIAALLAAGCGGKSDAKPAPASKAAASKPILKVAVSAEGAITADGKAVELTDLDSAFAKLATKQGEVWYHRDNPAGDPHPIALEVMNLVVKHQLPLRLFAQPDFSDALDGDD